MHPADLIANLVLVIALSGRHCEGLAVDVKEFVISDGLLESVEIPALYDYTTGVIFYKDESSKLCYAEYLGSNGFVSGRSFIISETNDLVNLQSNSNPNQRDSISESNLGKQFCGSFTIVASVPTPSLNDGDISTDVSRNKSGLKVPITNPQVHFRRKRSNGQYWPQQQGGASQSQIQGQVSGQGFFSGQAQSQLSGASQSQVQLSGSGIVGSVSSSAGSAQAQIALAQGTGSGQASSSGLGPSNSQVQVNLGEAGRGSLASASVLAGQGGPGHGQHSGQGSSGGAWTPGAGSGGYYGQNNGQRVGEYGGGSSGAPQQLLKPQAGRSTYQGIDGYVSPGGYAAGQQQPQGGLHSQQGAGFPGFGIAAPLGHLDQTAAGIGTDANRLGGQGQSRLGQQSFESGQRNGATQYGTGLEQQSAGRGQLGSGVGQLVGGGGGPFGAGVDQGASEDQLGQPVGGQLGSGRGQFDGSRLSPGLGLGQTVQGYPGGAISQPGQVDNGVGQVGRTQGHSSGTFLQPSGEDSQNGGSTYSQGSSHPSSGYQQTGRNGYRTASNGRNGGVSGTDGNGYTPYYQYPGTSPGSSQTQTGYGGSSVPQAFASSIGGGQAQAQTVYLGRGTSDFYSPSYGSSSYPGNGRNGNGRSQTQYVTYGSTGQRQQNGGQVSRVSTNGYRTNGNGGGYRQTVHTNGNGGGYRQTVHTNGNGGGDRQTVYTNGNGGGYRQTGLTNGNGNRQAPSGFGAVAPSGYAAGAPSQIQPQGYGSDRTSAGVPDTSGYIRPQVTSTSTAQRDTVGGTTGPGSGFVPGTQAIDQPGYGVSSGLPGIVPGSGTGYVAPDVSGGTGQTSIQPGSGQVAHIGQQGSYQPAVDTSSYGQGQLGQPQPGRSTSGTGGFPATHFVQQPGGAQDGYAPSYGVSQVSPDDPSQKRCTIITFSCTIMIESNGRAKICRPNVASMGGVGNGGNGGYKNGNGSGGGGQSQAICCC